MGVPPCQGKKLQGPITMKKTKAFALLCEHLTDAQLAYIQYCDNVRSAWEALCGVHEVKTIGNKLFLRRRFFTIKMQEGDDMFVHINTLKALADQLRSMEVNITDEDVYMVLFMSLLPSFDNLITSLESMSTKDVGVLIPRPLKKRGVVGNLMCLI